jgi:hypothetical protein
MSRKIFIHLSTKDVNRAQAFYTVLGFAVDEVFSGETHVCHVISDTIRVMLSAEPAFTTFSPRAICDTSKFLEVLNCLTCSSRDEVDDLVRRAVQAGGTVVEAAEDLGFMYQHSFLDPDGHAWNLFHVTEAPRMDAGAIDHSQNEV